MDSKKRTEGKRRTGFLTGQMRVPHDFDSMAAKEIQDLFEGTVVAEKPTAG